MTPDIDVRRGDVLSAWAGIRPLVRDPAAGDTASLVRNHVVHIRYGLSSFGLLCWKEEIKRCEFISMFQLQPKQAGDDSWGQVDDLSRDGF